jgi:hypothetical protein
MANNGHTFDEVDPTSRLYADTVTDTDEIKTNQRKKGSMFKKVALGASILGALGAGIGYKTLHNSRPVVPSSYPVAQVEEQTDLRTKSHIEKYMEGIDARSSDEASSLEAENALRKYLKDEASGHKGKGVAIRQVELLKRGWYTNSNTSDEFRNIVNIIKRGPANEEEAHFVLNNIGKYLKTDGIGMGSLSVADSYGITSVVDADSSAFSPDEAAIAKEYGLDATDYKIMTVKWSMPKKNGEFNILAVKIDGEWQLPFWPYKGK